MNSQPLQIFKTDVKSMMPNFFYLALGLSCLIPFGWFMQYYNFGTFEYKEDDVILLKVAWRGFLGIAIFLWGLAQLFPVKVFQNGIMSYDRFGFYHFVAWGKITEVSTIRYAGFPYVYLYIESEDLKYPIKIPMFLEKVDDFRRLIKAKDSSGHLSSEINI